MSNDDLREWSSDTFRPLLGEVFVLSDGTGTLAITLIEVTDLREGQAAGMRSRQFSLTWRGPPGQALPQRIYSLSHAALGTVELFLVTIGPDAEGMRYEAVFT